MTEPNNTSDTSSRDAQKDILSELRKSNQLLERLLEIQTNVQGRQRRFWYMGMFQMAVIVMVLFWFGSKYGF